MKVYCYSPSVDVYVMTGNGVMDLSRDVASCTVSRSTDSVATANIELNNDGGKYNGLIHPMDRITVFATKASARNQLFTGYINSVPSFTLYPQGFKITASCTLYRLQKLYWDPGLAASSALLTSSYDRGALIATQDANNANLITKLLMNVGGIPPNMIHIQESLPLEIEQFARSMYLAKAMDISQIGNAVDEFYKLISQATPSVTVGANGGIVETESGGKYTISTTATTKQGRVAEVAANAPKFGIPCTQGYCLAFAQDVYDVALNTHVQRVSSAIEAWNKWGNSSQTSKNNVPIGAAVYGSGTSSAYGHVGIMLPDGKVADNIGYHCISDSIDAWLSWQTATCQGHRGWIGWSWMGEDLSK